MTQTRLWSLVTAVVVVVLLAAGWLLLLSPVRSKVADLQTQKVSQESANDQSRARNVELKAEAAKLEAQEKRIKALQSRIPATVELPDVIRKLAGNAADVGVDVVGISPQPPTAIGGASTPTASGAPTAPAGDPLYMVPVTVDVKGAYKELESLLRKLEGLNRIFLVNGISVRPTEDPAVLAMSVTGRVFTRSPRTDGSAIGTTPPTPTSTPLPTSSGGLG